MKPGRFALLGYALVVGASPAAAGEECTCRYFDQRVEIGAVACINGKLAQCLMFLNNPSWKFISDTCPVTRREPDPRGKASKAKVAAR